jgi:hypothetical protein
VILLRVALSTRIWRRNLVRGGEKWSRDNPISVKHRSSFRIDRACGRLQLLHARVIAGKPYHAIDREAELIAPRYGQTGRFRLGVGLFQRIPLIEYLSPLGDHIRFELIVVTAPAVGEMIYPLVRWPVVPAHRSQYSPKHSPRPRSTPVIGDEGRYAGDVANADTTDKSDDILLEIWISLRQPVTGVLAAAIAWGLRIHRLAIERRGQSLAGDPERPKTGPGRIGATRHERYREQRNEQTSSGWHSLAGTRFRQPVYAILT